MTIHPATQRENAGEPAPEEVVQSVGPGPIPALATWAGRLLLTALFLDLAGTKWASYLPTPIAGLYLPDGILACSALLAFLAWVSGYPVRRFSSAVLASACASAYVMLRIADTLGRGPDPNALWIRDMAPFLYLTLLPPLVVAAQTIPFSALLRTVRLATACMGLVVASGFVGLLAPIDIGTELPLFSLRPDVDSTVLGIGVLAFGGWGPAGQPRRWVQAVLVLLVATNYSRAGLVAALLCVAVAVARERRTLSFPWMVGTALVAWGFIGMVVLLWPTGAAVPIAAPEALSRLATSNLEGGTTGARLAAWETLMNYTLDNGDLLSGAGPSAEPLITSGAVAHLSGAEDVRAPHNWLIGAVAYHGFVGLLSWLLAFARVLLPRNLRGGRLLPAAGITAYITASLFGVVVESPFGSLPMVAMAAWVLAHEPQEESHRAGSARSSLYRDVITRNHLTSVN